MLWEIFSGGWQVYSLWWVVAVGIDLSSAFQFLNTELLQLSGAELDAIEKSWKTLKESNKPITEHSWE